MMYASSIAADRKHLGVSGILDFVKIRLSLSKPFFLFCVFWEF